MSVIEILFIVGVIIAIIFYTSKKKKETSEDSVRQNKIEESERQRKAMEEAERQKKAMEEAAATQAQTQAGTSDSEVDEKSSEDVDGFTFAKGYQYVGQGGYSRRYYGVLMKVDKFKKGNVVVPSQVNIGGETLDVELIKENAFNGCIFINSITLPDTVKTIGRRGDQYDTSAYISHAFKCCRDLVKISIPNTVSFIGMASFEGCPHLKAFEVRKVQENSKVSAWKLTTDELGRTILYSDVEDLKESKPTSSFFAVKSLADSPSVEQLIEQEIKNRPEPTMDCLVFSTWCAHQTSGSSWYDAAVSGIEGSICPNIVVPEVVFLKDKQASLTPIEGYAAYQVSSLTSRAFISNNTVKTIYLPNTMLEIGSRDHQNVSSTYEIRYDSDCFDNCTNLESISIPDRVSFIGTTPFSNCSKLSTIAIRDTGYTKMSTSTWRLSKKECQDITLVSPKKYSEQLERLSKYFKSIELK